MAAYVWLVALLALALPYRQWAVYADAGESEAGGAAEGCEIRARTTGGWVRGARRETPQGLPYASFTGVPYAKQPLGKLRFKELEPVERWSEDLDARETGCVCPQHDVFYGRLAQPRCMAEACIHANVYTPLHSLPCLPPAAREPAPGLPVLVFIHGGGFAFGSGDPDLYGPEDLVASGVVVITFNYRLNVFGFLSLQSAEVPGNMGLRDMVTLLRWVRDNARAFGGDPDDVTLGGQSAGAASAHLLTLSPEAKGLFKRAILMSGTALPVFYSTSPLYAKFVSDAFVSALGVNSSAPRDVHRALVHAPLHELQQVHRMLIDKFGLAVFFPVVDAGIPGVKPVLPEATEAMLARGVGKDIPLLIGYTDKEAESFRRRLEEVDIVKMVNENPLTTVPLSVTFSSPPEVALERAKMIDRRYFNASVTMDKYVQLCTDMYFEYPALTVSRLRQAHAPAHTFLYRFSYDAAFSPLKAALGLNFTGAGHVEDMTFVMRVNSEPPPEQADGVHVYWDDEYMRRLMITYIVNFIRYSHPTFHDDAYSTDFSWKSVGRPESTSTGGERPEPAQLRHMELHSPRDHHTQDLLTPRQLDSTSFFDALLRG